MGDFFKELMGKMPEWFFAVAAILVLVGIAGILVWFVLGAYRYSREMGKDTKLQQLQESLQKERQYNKANEERASQLAGALAAIKPLINTLNKIRSFTDVEEVMYETVNLIRRATDNLASDIKFRAGEKHRCGLWIEQNRVLQLQFASAGFPTSYLNNRTLEVDRSIAGKSFRLKTIINEPDVTVNDEWQKNDQSTSKYKSLICIPVSTWGVLTIDGFHPMNDEVMMIGEVYATLLEGAFLEYVRTFEYLQSEQEDVI